jgi:uncharacterized membrane protein YbaN (DUF454 family)
MNIRNPSPREKSLAYKAVLIAAIAVCLVLGVIGLILPIIPGLLFLALAVMLASKLSTRIARWAGKLSLVKGWAKHSHAVKGLSPAQRLRLAFWVSARYAVNSFSSLANKLSSKGKNL